VRHALALLLLAGCPRPLDPQNGCAEVATAIGARTEECTGDSELGVERIERMEGEYDCLPVEMDGSERYMGEDAYACAIVMRNVACELVEQDGDDLDAWLLRSPSCALALVAR
jgi:hypothetical protein